MRDSAGNRDPDFIEFLGTNRDRVAMTHPNDFFFLQTRENGARAADLQHSRSIFTLRVLHRSAILFGDFLVSEAESDDRDRQVVNAFVVLAIFAKGG